MQALNEIPSTFSCLNAPFVVSYAGSLGSGYDIETIIESAGILELRFPGCFVFKIAGGGQKSALLEAVSTPNLCYYGYLSTSEIFSMLSCSHSMLLPYVSNSAVALPIKFFDAVNFRLPVVSSLGLEAGDLIKEYMIGSCYQAGSAESLCESIIAVREAHAEYHRNMCVFSDLFSDVYELSQVYAEFARELLL
ncbi:hypothetical protein KBY58_03380 [Cyanobium sp. HWJ4-Hawea]|uniref:hypothetical protein n=1 Tax=Cyanobium sp. HWJ4-Hawea TaxID=2823713 RepID=UPI0020CDD6DE|nr:hypothetical protein [Cyanobium sp. HWJ4-Hawea]MCP9808475.1 hypothetical protein [Cyanobium sp. HWJ4-Hawea]